MADDAVLASLNFGSRQPRVTDDTVGSAGAWDSWCNEVDAMGNVFTVRRVGTIEQYEGGATNNGIIAGFDYILPWTTLESLERADMWTAAMSTAVRMQERGTFMFELQVRFAAVGPVTASGAQRFGVTGGRRWARIMKNGTSPAANTIARNDRPGLGTGAGTTVKAIGMSTCQPGDVIWCGFRSSHPGGGMITSLNNDIGGTFLTIKRVGTAVS